MKQIDTPETNGRYKTYFMHPILEHGMLHGSCLMLFLFFFFGFMFHKVYIIPFSDLMIDYTSAQIMRELKTFFFPFFWGFRLSVHNNSEAKEEYIKALVASSTSSSLKLVLYLK